jgi:hypothetical protein
MEGFPVTLESVVRAGRGQGGWVPILAPWTFQKSSEKGGKDDRGGGRTERAREIENFQL